MFVRHLNEKSELTVRRLEQSKQLLRFAKHRLLVIIASRTSKFAYFTAPNSIP